MNRMVSFFFCGLFIPVALHADDIQLWNLHGQTTLIPQAHAPFHSPYSGPNSLASDFDAQMTFTATIFSGLRLWPGAAIYFDPEATAGSGLSGGLGLAGVPNDEGARVGTRALRIAMARLFVRQIVSLGGTTTKIEDAPNQLASEQTSKRVTITFGKLSATDIFDNNSYSHDPRTQFHELGAHDKRRVGLPRGFQRLHLGSRDGIILGILDVAGRRFSTTSRSQWVSLRR